MRVLWTYHLPELGDDTPDCGQAPLYWDGDARHLRRHDVATGETEWAVRVFVLTCPNDHSAPALVALGA